VGYQDVEVVGQRKSGFRKRLRFLLNTMRQQSVDDFLMIVDKCIWSIGSEEWTVRAELNF
jgi:hypothetical protein